MTSIEVKKLGSWIQTRNVLIENLGMNMEFQNEAEYSDNPSSDFQKAQVNIDRIFDKLQKHAVNGLKLIDETIKDSEIITEISKLSAEAKKEADLLKKVTKTIKKLTNAVDKVSDVVTKVAGLPFL